MKLYLNFWQVTVDILLCSLMQRLLRKMRYLCSIYELYIMLIVADHIYNEIHDSRRLNFCMTGVFNFACVNFAAGF